MFSTLCAIAAAAAVAGQTLFFEGAMVGATVYAIGKGISKARNN